MKNRIGYCGLNCDKCDAYIATVNNDDVLRAKTAKLWGELNGVEILPEMINCYGCKAQGTKTYFCENLCAVRKCATKKEYETCADCANVEKCKTVGEVLANSPEATDNLAKSKTK